MNQNNTGGGNKFTNNASGAVSGGEVSFFSKLKNLNIKKSISALLIIIILVAIGFVLFKDSSSKENKDIAVHTPYPNMVSVEGTVKNIFEGVEDLNYSFDIPETATTAKVTEDGFLIKVVDREERQSSVYFYYQGSKNLTPEDYIKYIISPHVSAIELKEKSNIGNYEWQTASTAGSDWFVASLNEGEWIVAIESKKVWLDQSLAMVESFKLK